MYPVFAWVMASIITFLAGVAIAAGIRSWVQARRFRRQGGALTAGRGRRRRAGWCPERRGAR